MVRVATLLFWFVVGMLMSKLSHAAEISSTPFVDFLAPYINVIVEAVVGAALTWLSVKVNQWFNVKINAAQLDKLKSAAATEAGKLVARAEDNLRNRSIDVSSPMVVAAAARIEAGLPGAAKAVGATPEHLQSFVAGELGKLQARQVSVPTVPPATPMLGRAG